MRSFKLLGSRARYIVAAAGLVSLGVVAPFASALGQATERSIALSSSTKGASGVSYQINFTATSAAGAFIVEFCSNTPLIGETCTDPSTSDGFSTASVASTDSDQTAVSHPANNQVIVTTDMTADEDVSIDLTGIHNPNTAGPLYARIVTYDTAAHAGSEYTSSSGLGADAVDAGSVALSITDGVNVSGAVLETMIFCVSGGQDAAHPEINPIGAGCTGSLTAPTLKLGKDTAGVIALASDNVYSGTIYTQLSTNASKGAIVNLKSSAANCGGLVRSSDTSACDIGPAGNTTGVEANKALFGLKLGANVTDATDGDIVASGSYDDTHYRLNYVDGSTGVTSTYGDPILTTNSKPANNRDMPLTFGASISNNTPAGNYSADLSLIATGKF